MIKIIKKKSYALASGKATEIETSDGKKWLLRCFKFWNPDLEASLTRYRIYRCKITEENFEVVEEASSMGYYEILNKIKSGELK